MLPNLPKRFGNQAALEAYAKPLTDDEFGELCAVLRDRKWTAVEFEQRVQPLRPDHEVFSSAE